MSSAFQFEERGDGIGVLTLDLPDKKVNTLSQAVLAELGGHARRPGGAGRPPRPPVPERQARPVHRRGRPQRAGRPRVRRQGAGRPGGRDGAPALRAGRPAAVPDRRPRRRQLHGGRDRADPGDGRADRLSTCSQTKIALPETKIGIIPGWGGHAATASPDRPERDRDDLHRRADLRRGRPSNWAWRSTPSPPRSCSRRASGGSKILAKTGEWKTRAREAPGPARPLARPARLRLRDRRGGDPDEDQGAVSGPPRRAQGGQGRLQPARSRRA